jgi:hypothetical protein
MSCEFLDTNKSFQCYAIKSLPRLKEDNNSAFTIPQLTELVCNADCSKEQRRKDCSAFRDLEDTGEGSVYAKRNILRFQIQRNDHSYKVPC